MKEANIDKNGNRITRINNLYSRILLCSEEISPDYYSSLRKSLILEKVTGILTAKANLESPDGRYFLFDYEDFRILHSLLSNDKNIQNGIEYIYGISLAYDENKEKDMITRLILKTADSEFLYISCSQKRNVTVEVIRNPSYDDLYTKLSPKPEKIFNVLNFLSESIDYDLLKENHSEKPNNKKYSFKDFIRDTNVPVCSDIPTYIISAPRPSIKCKDGFNIFVQASSYNECSPKLSGLDIYSTFEVLSKDKINEFSSYLSKNKYVQKNDHTKTLIEYDCVPLKNIESLIESHGGINKKATLDNCSNEASELEKLSYVKKVIVDAQNKN